MSDFATQKRVAAVVLAAGSSKRMGTPKQLIEIERKTLLRRTVEVVLASRVDWVGVTLPDDDAALNEALEAALLGLNWARVGVANSREGQSKSLRAGLEMVETGDFAAILWTPCDLPLLESAHLDALLAKYRGGNWPVVASCYADVLGAPLILGRELWPQIKELRGDTGARKIVARCGENAGFVEWEGGQFDLDTPEDVAEFGRAKQ